MAKALSEQNDCTAITDLRCRPGVPKDLLLDLFSRAHSGSLRPPLGKTTFQYSEEGPVPAALACHVFSSSSCFRSLCY